MGNALMADLIDNLGKPTDILCDDHIVHLFPTPQEILDSDLSFLRTTGQRKKTLHTFCQAIVNNEISLESTQDTNAFVINVLRLKGIGPWTAEYIALKALRNTDAFPKTDLIIAREIKKIEKPRSRTNAAMAWLFSFIALATSARDKVEMALGDQRLNSSKESSMNTKQIEIKTTIGPIHITASVNGIQSVLWKEGAQGDPASKTDLLTIDKYLKTATQEIQSYLDSQLKSFTFPIDLKGTEFQKKVWKQLTTIPYGHTISYKELAIKVGSPNAYRAVGTANSKNPISIAIPCHRVISSSGGPGWICRWHRNQATPFWI